jgi:predicted dehydrogenase
LGASKKLIQQDYPSVNSYASLEDLLRSDAHLVIVNTPVGTHFEYAKKVLLAETRYIVEKAFTTTVAEAEELVALATEKGVKLSVSKIGDGIAILKQYVRFSWMVC